MSSGSRLRPAAATPHTVCALLALAACASLPAHGAHPLATEDMGTQGRGHAELELGYQQARESGTRASELGPQLSYGLFDNLDVVVRPSLVWLSGAEAAHGYAGTATDLKWRIAELGVWHLGVRAGWTLLSGNRDVAENGTSFHATAIASYYPDDESSWHFNAGYTRVPDTPSLRRDIYHASLAMLQQVHERARVSLELTADSHPDANRSDWLTAVRAGLIVTCASWADADVGVQTKLGAAGPSVVALAGVTLRW